MALHLKPGDSKRVPWKNGRGTTLEIATDATASRTLGVPAAQPLDWSWRLSIADVPESGPFSIFEGCDRHIALVDGDGMRLVIDDATHEVPRDGKALAFRGEATAAGQLLGGPCRDINLMLRRERWRGGLELRRGEGEASVPASAVVIAHVIAGSAEATEGSGVGHALGPGESLVLKGGSLHLAHSGVVAIARLETVSGRA